MPPIPKRQTAYKLWISDIVNSKINKAQSELEFDNFLIRNKKVSRVNLIATITQKYQSEDKNYVALTIDDGSGMIRIKSWREDTQLIEDFNIGDSIIVIGKLRTYNEENYLTPEIVRLIKNLKWQTLRKLELTKEYGTSPPTMPKPQQDTHEIKQDIVEETIEDFPTHNSRQLIFDIITKYNSENGVDLSKVIEESKLTESEADSIIQELLKEGEIFQPSQGKVKIIE